MLLQTNLTLKNAKPLFLPTCTNVAAPLTREKTRKEDPKWQERRTQRGCVAALRSSRCMKRFLKTLLKSFTVSRAANKPLFISASRQLPIIPGERLWITVVCSPKWRSLWNYAHMQSWKWEAPGQAKKESECKKKTNYSAYFLKGHLYSAAAPAPASKSCWFFQVVLQHPVLPGRIKPITMGKNSPNTWLHKVQGLGQTRGQDYTLSNTLHQPDLISKEVWLHYKKTWNFQTLTLCQREEKKIVIL